MIIFFSYLRKMSFYAVGVGRQVGVYSTWPECQKQVLNISNAKYRKFKTHKEAVSFIQECKEKYSPYKNPITDSTFPRVTSLSQPQHSNNVLHENISSSQLFSLTQQRQPNRTDLFSKAQPYSSVAKAMATPSYGNETTSVSRNDRLSPETLSAIAHLSDNDPFEEEPREDISKKNMKTCDCSSIKDFMKKVDKYFVDIKSTLGHMMVKIHDLDTKVEALTNLNVEMSNKASTSEAGSRSVKRNLLANYDVPQPLGSRRQMSTSLNDSEIEVVPVPPKKIPKIELHSDEEVDGFDYDFKVNDSGYVIVYTDGACENNGKRNAKAGIGVWFGDSHPLNCSEPVRGRATNNTAEIQAAVQAVQIARRAGVKKLLLHTDSEFLINCITKWVKGWQKKGWKVASGNPVKNKDDLILLLDSLEGIDVKWEHVRGHSGIHGNEMADRLARSGAERYKS